jgi:hypothetical protein
VKRSYIVLIFFAVLLYFSYQFQITSKNDWDYNYGCQTGKGGLECHYKSGFPFVYLEVNEELRLQKDHSIPRSDFCESYGCSSKKNSLSQANILFFLADVVIFAILLALVPVFTWWIIFRVLKIPFRISLLIISFLLSIVFNVLTLTSVSGFPFPVLAIVSMVLIAPLINNVGSNLYLGTIALVGLPVFLGFIMFYIIIGCILKAKNKQRQVS